MTDEQRAFLNRINQYAENVLGEIDPQKVQVSLQLEKLKPVMEEIAREKNTTLEDVFIKYMDMASQITVSNQTKFQNTVGNMTQYGDIQDINSL